MALSDQLTKIALKQTAKQTTKAAAKKGGLMVVKPTLHISPNAQTLLTDPTISPAIKKQSEEVFKGIYSRYRDKVKVSASKDPEELAERFAAAKKDNTQWYRLTYKPNDTLKEGFRATTNITPIEPAGMYYALDPTDIPPLVTPGEPATRESLKDMLKLNQHWSMTKAPVKIKEDPITGNQIPATPPSKRRGEFYKNLPGVIRAIPETNAVIKDLSDPDDYFNYLRKVAAGTKYEKEVTKILDSNFEKGLYSNMSYEFSDLLTTTLEKEATHVIIPDAVAGQPHIKQVVALVPGFTIGKKGKRFAVLSVAGGLTGIGALLGTDDAEAGPRDLFRLSKNAAKFIQAPAKSAVPGGASHKPLGVVFTEGRNKLANAIMESEEQQVKYSVKDLLKYGKEVKGEEAGILKAAYKGKKPIFETTEPELYEKYKKFLVSSGLDKASKEEQRNAWTDHLSEAYGAVKVKDTTTYRGSSKANQWIVLDPNDVSAKMDPVAHPEAYWIQPPLKSSKGIPEKDMSSSYERLNGTQFQGKTIKHVTQGHGNKRYIVTEDGAAIPVDKSILNSLSRARGTEKYIADFINKDSDGKLAQAYKSLKLHKARAATDPSQVEDYFKLYRDQLGVSGSIVPDLSLVQIEGKYISFPTQYAKILEPEGIIKIIKDLK